MAVPATALMPAAPGVVAAVAATAMAVVPAWFLMSRLSRQSQLMPLLMLAAVTPEISLPTKSHESVGASAIST